jgi:SM-20-related protein
MPTLFNPKLLNSICDGLAESGYVQIDDAFPQDFMFELQHQVESLDADQFKSAGIGRADDFQTNSQIRRDKILWLDENLLENQSYFDWTEALRLALNKRFFLGLFDYECMFAHYPQGAFYQKHVDAFKQPVHQKGNNRKVSTVLYLNPNWQPGDGGELLLYEHNQDLPFKSISPELGRLVVFLSEDFPHEVLPVQVSRYSLTGWFRTNHLMV